MKFKSAIVYVLLCVISVSFTGCSLYDAKTNTPNESASTKDQLSTDSASTENDTTNSLATDSSTTIQDTTKDTTVPPTSGTTDTTTEELVPIEETVTPYQFLNLMVGNAEQIFCEYTITQASDNREDRATFYRQGDKTAVIFTTYGMDNEEQTVQEIEMDGKVFYYMWDKEKVASYLAPANDIFVNELMRVLNSELISTSTEENFITYDYSVPFSQDESISFGYRFYMSDNVLKKVTVSVNGELSQTYVFGDFKSDPMEDSVFDFPIDMPLTEYDYPYIDDSSAPWWE